VTGPAAITADELAAITSELTGVQVTHISVPVPALIEGMTGHGLPAPVAALLASFDSAATRGDYAATSTAVRDFGGVAPTSVRAFLTSQRAAFAPA
jgi:NAD(P)H dehydrogenase (quinone)